MRPFRPMLLFVMIFVALPLAAHAVVWWSGEHASSWATADWSSTRTLPAPSAHQAAMVRVYSARTGRWKGVFATHSWLVLKEHGAASYERWDKVGWGAPVRRNNYAPDARWYGNDPEVLYEITGERAEALIPAIRAAIRAYRHNRRGDYRVWPGPNSNTFVADVVSAVPQLSLALPPTAIGKDFPAQGDWFGPTPSRTGVRLTLGGYLGVAAGWVEGLEINILGAVVGLDIRRPGLKLPGFGRIGL